MQKIICDLCGKEVGMGTTITVERPWGGQLGLPGDEVLHLHIECEARLRNQFKNFADKVREENCNTDG